MPSLIVLILVFELIEVELKAVSLGCHGAEVCLHAEVVAGLEAGTGLIHVVVKVFVEVGQGFLVELALFHALLEDHASS